MKDEKRIHNIAKVINEQQKHLSEMFYSDNAIAISGANEDENIKRIVDILEEIIEEINKN